MKIKTLVNGPWTIPPCSLIFFWYVLLLLFFFFNLDHMISKYRGCKAFVFCHITIFVLNYIYIWYYYPEIPIFLHVLNFCYRSSGLGLKSSGTLQYHDAMNFYRNASKLLQNITDSSPYIFSCFSFFTINMLLMTSNIRFLTATEFQL